MTSSTTTVDRDFASLVALLVEGAAQVSRMAADGAWSTVPVSCAAELTADLYRARDALTATAVAGVTVVHASGALPVGHVSTRRWLEVATGMSGASAGAALARSRSLSEAGYARTRMAWLAGLISDDMVRAITTGVPVALRRLNVAEVPEVVARIEAQLVPYALDHSVDEVRTTLKRLRIALDPDGVDERELAAYDEEQLVLVPVGDGYEVRGYLTKESAAALLTVLERTVDSWFREGSLTPEQQTLSGEDVRSTGRRRGRRAHLHAQALAELCQQLLDDGALGTQQAQRPHVTVTVDAEDYRAGLGGLLQVPGREPEPITTAMVDRFLCDADITSVLTRTLDVAAPEPDRDSAAPDAAATETRGTGMGTAVTLSHAWLHDAVRETLYVGRAHRTPPRRLRTALAARDRHCQLPDCRVASDRCRAHHVRFWSQGGRTVLDNLVLVCEVHHTRIHLEKWHVTPTPGRRPGMPGCWSCTPPPRPRP
jgi:hypothetical protein